MSSSRLLAARIALRQQHAQRRTVLALARRAYATPARYQPSEERDPQVGDYPELPYISRQRLPAKGWWDPQMRRNFGDPLHEREELLSMWGPDIPTVAPEVAARQLFMAFMSFVAFGFACKYALTPDMPAIRREYPYDGLFKEMGSIEENKARAESISEDE